LADLNALHDILISLQQKRLIIVINNEENEVKQDPNIKYLVRSRIGHILWCLQNSKDMRDIDQSDWNPNVADLKYIKYDKMVSKWNQDLKQIIEEDYFRNHFNLHAEADLLTGIIDKFREDKFSQFQINSINAILNGLSNKNTRDPKGVCLVAETGAGKSLAYQIPLLLWIIAKKINLLQKFRTVTDARKHTNCFSLLLFPRNTLAKDQNNSLSERIETINSVIERWPGIDSEKKEYFKIKLKKDFGGTGYENRIRIFKEDETDIIITNTETLKRRLNDPLSHNLFKYGIDLVLYDEVHLYEGLHGSYVAGLNCRLVNLISYSYKRNFTGSSPLFVGMSATIDGPDKHCQKLFALREKPIVIDDKNDEKIKRSTEHHFILKPRTGRVPLGVAVDATSCLIHNRRDGLQNYHRSDMDDEERPKSITFVDSLDGTARFTNYLNNLEWYDLTTPIPTRWPVKRRYPAYFKPLMRDDDVGVCDDCKNGTDVLVGTCDEYSRGNCWYFSQDNGHPGFWKQKQGGRYNYPTDNIRSKRVTSQEVAAQKESDTNYVFYTESSRDVDFRNTVELNEKIDNLIATPVLEVGIDFKKISEIILYGNIRSPASYKQKSGRGAREGNIDDGLCIMSVIYNTPLSNFYFKHFERLVRPYQSPIKLEVRNPDVVTSQCFASVFDFFAANDVELYKVRKSQDDEEVTKLITQEYKKAKTIIDSTQLDDYLKRFLNMLDYPLDQSKSTIDSCIKKIKELFDQLTDEVSIGEKKKPLIDWISQAPRDPRVQRDLEEQFESEFEESDIMRKQMKEKSMELKKEFLNFKKALLQINNTQLNNKIEELEELLKNESY
jgi:superfamily II DNA/RNA helicase